MIKITFLPDQTRVKNQKEIKYYKYVYEQEDYFPVLFNNNENDDSSKSGLEAQT